MERLYERAWALYDCGRYEEAEVHLKVLAVENPSLPYFWKAWGHALKMLRRYQEALEAYQIALMLGDESSPFLIHMAECFKETGQLNKAKKILSIVLNKVDPQEKKVIEEIKKAWCN